MEEKCWESVSENEIRVNLDMFVDPKCTDADGEIMSFLKNKNQQGWVSVEKREASLYVGGKKVFLQTIQGKYQDYQGIEEIIDCEIEGRNVLHPNIGIALAENTHLIPLEWDDKALHFWGAIFREKVVECWIFSFVMSIYGYGGEIGWRKEGEYMMLGFMDTPYILMLEDK